MTLGDFTYFSVSFQPTNLSKEHKSQLKGNLNLKQGPQQNSQIEKLKENNSHEAGEAALTHSKNGIVTVSSGRYCKDTAESSG